MMCSDCGKKEAFAKGLCQTCYARDRRKNGKKPCSVGGCGNPAVSKGLCSKHAQQATRRAKVRRVPDQPGERWKNIDGHHNWMISTMGRVKSLRGLHERLITPRVVSGRLFIDDRANGSFAVHLMVLKTFRPEVTGVPIFVDGNPLNVRLDNLKWDTRQMKVLRAAVMAEQSTSKWGPAFAAYWRGDKQALDCFFTEMRSYLLKTLRRKVDAFWGEYRKDLDGLVHATLVKCFFSIHAATIKSLDGITGYLLTIADNLLRKHWHYSCPLVPISCGGAVDGDVTNIDMDGYYHPSAELEAIANEMVHAS